jgi:hypothetical protein
MSQNSTQSSNSLEQAQIRELEQKHRIEKLEMENEKCKMEIKFLKRLSQQQRKFDIEKKGLLQRVKKVDSKLEEEQQQRQQQQQQQQQELFFSHHGFHADSFRSELSPNGDELLLFKPQSRQLSLSSSHHDIARIMAYFTVTSIDEINYDRRQVMLLAFKTITQMPPVFRKVFQEIKSLQGRLISSEQEGCSLQQSLQQQRKGLKLKLQQYSKSFMDHPPQMDDPIITQFQSVRNQNFLYELAYRRLEASLVTYAQYINSTPLAVFRYLIETKGMKINPTDNLFYSAFQSFNINRGGDVNVLFYLLSKLDVGVNSASYYDTLLQNALSFVNTLPLDVFKHLIEINGANVNDQKLREIFCNFRSNDSSVKDIFMYLLSQKNIDVNAKSHDGRTWLQLVCTNPHFVSLDILKRLIEKKGAKVDDCDPYNCFPLYLLLMHSSSKPDSELSQIVQYLIQNGGKAHLANSSPLSSISQHTHPLTYQLVMDAQKK